MPACNHTQTKEISEGGFLGSVAVYPYTEENRAAHGNITVAVECVKCGARQSQNINGNHIEVSPWAGSREERRRIIEKAEGKAYRALQAAKQARLTLVCEDGRKLHVRVSHEDGCILLDGSPHTSREADEAASVAMTDETFARLAMAARTAVLEFEAITHEMS